MKKVFILLFASAVLFAACGPNRDERVKQIQDYETATFEKAVAADTLVADTLTLMYEQFANKYPKDSLAPIYLLKAGEVQANVLHTERSVAFFNRIINEYPDFAHIPMCYYFKGFAYELDSQYEKAKAAYEEYLDKFPEHELASDTRKALPLLGMSYEDQLNYILSHASDTIIAQAQ